MFANSRRVHSAQTGPHPDLPLLLARHLAHPFRKPVADYNRAALESALAAWRAWNPAAPLILDSGCGVGWSTLQLARRHAPAFVLGVDQSADRLGRGKAALGEAPPNMALIRADLVDFWRLLVAAGVRLQAHYLLYPNPWPKVGQVQRRWHGHPVFPALLQLGGRLECRSNWRIYVEELALALQLAAGANAAPLQVEAWLPQAPDTCLTPFERKYHQSGQALWRLVVPDVAAWGGAHG